MKKRYITSIILILLVLFIMGYLYFPKNTASPNKYFSEEKVAKIYLEFKKGGNLEYHSKIPNEISVITDEDTIKHFYEMFKSLDFDLWARHRGDRDYSVYINIGEHRSKKYLIKMSRIDGGYVFFFEDGLYRNDDLAKRINELLKISSN